MSPGAAYAAWIVGETLFVAAGAFAIWSICRDVRRAWPRIAAILKGTDNDG